MTNKIAVFSVDDHAVMREVVASVINAQPDMCLVAQASTGNQAIKHFREYKADVTLMDLSLPDMSGIEAMKVIRAEFPDARFIVLSIVDCDDEIRRALAAGAQAYVLKSMPPRELVDAIRQVHAGKQKIATREHGDGNMETGSCEKNRISRKSESGQSKTLRLGALRAIARALADIFDQSSEPWNRIFHSFQTGRIISRVESRNGNVPSVCPLDLRG